MAGRTSGRLIFSALPVFLAACGGDESLHRYAPEGTVYALEELNGRPFAAETRLRFPEPGAVAGAGPCNTFTARQTVPYPWIRIEAMTATERGCAELEAEEVFFGALVAMTLAEALGDVLILSNDAGDQMVFRAVHGEIGRTAAERPNR